MKLLILSLKRLLVLITVIQAISAASAESLVGIPVWDIELSKHGGIIQGPIRLIGKDAKISGPLAFCYDFDVRSRTHEFLNVMNALRPKTLVTIEVGPATVKIRDETVQCIQSGTSTANPDLREEILATALPGHLTNIFGTFDKLISISNSCISDIEQREHKKACRDVGHIQRSLFLR